VDNADEPYAVALAAGLQGQFLETTTQLADLVRNTLVGVFKRTMPEEERLAETKRALQRTFQALRIEVNNEFGCARPLSGDLARLSETGWTRGDHELSFR
jgi:16S rRNA (cytosine1402-N4)-methyltransferase